MHNLFQKLMFGASTGALIASGVLINRAQAQAQAAAPAGGDQIEQVIVTGTSIKGVAVAGSNVTQVQQADITDIGMANVTEALVDTPAIEGFGNAGRGNTNSTNGQPGVSLYIHDIGAMGSGTTLVLIDGHRAVESGQTNYFVNPNILPTNMLERVDVLSDGSSAVYGSDAIAGVINFVTRKQFEGVQLSAQHTFIAGSGGTKANILVGHGWDSGNFLIGAEYAYDDKLRDTSRPWTNPLIQNLRAAADNVTGPNSTNFGNFNCSPATIQPAGSSGIYLSPTSTTSVTNSTANQPCNSAWQVGALLPSESRESMMMKVSQSIFPRVTMDADILIASRQNYAPTSRGTVTATAFGTGAQANPFYVNPPGVSAASQTVRYDFNALLGPGAYTKGAEDTMMGTVSFTYNVDDNWEVDFLSTEGRDSNETSTYNTVNGPSVLLALNGTATTGGNTTTSDIPGYTGAAVTNLPLTTANALDVWHSGASNGTSAATKTNLTNNETMSEGIYSYMQQRLSIQGTVFDLPAGPLKIAVGVEMFDYNLNNLSIKPALAAAASYDSLALDFFNRRNDIAQYAELDVPVISPGMGIPFVQKVDLNLAVRRDDYNDVGDTVNPKVGFTLSVNQDLKLRGNWSTSFMAPPMVLTGISTNGLTIGSSIAGGTGGGSISVSLYPLVTQLGIPGCTATSASCSISTIQGISKGDGNPNVTVSHGRSWSMGADYAPSWLDGFNVDLTYWNTELLGGVVGPMFSQATSGPFASTFLVLYPNCATAAEIAAWALAPSKPGTTPQQVPQTAAYPVCAQFLVKNEPGNYQYNYADGIDLTAKYRFNLESVIGEDIGNFTIGTNLTQIMKFDDAFSLGPPPPSQIFSSNNTDGYNVGFPTVAFTSRSHFGWIWKGIIGDLWMNYTGGYKNISATSLNTYGSYPNGNVNINVGGDHVNPNVTFDAHLGYLFNGGVFGDDMVSLNVNNIADTEPPFFNSSLGYDASEGNPLGRTISLSLTLKK